MFPLQIMTGNYNHKNENLIAFLEEGIIMNILLRLPTAVCIARFRCVCRSWRILLSDPQFIYKIIFFQNLSDLKTLRILFTGAEEAFVDSHVIYYSLHSYDTLRPISAGPNNIIVREMPSFPYKPRHSSTMFSPMIIGCCDGIFCINEWVDNNMTDIILWNPETSEIKCLPVCLSLCPFPNGLEIAEEIIGFGFDPQTTDYKVVRSVRYTASRTIRGREYLMHLRTLFMKYIPQRDAPRNERCYWFLRNKPNCRIVSFDMSKEVFEVEKPESSLPYPVSRDSWFATESCYMLKESFVATLAYKGRYDVPMEVWALLKYGSVESWTKLFTFQPPFEINYYLEVWKEGTHICSPQVNRMVSEDDYVIDYDGVYIFNPATQEIGDRLDMQGRTWPCEAHTYTPTLVTLSDRE
ncbi:unnamed protein product [Linum tenue]|uniref:F-box domain-containing protein n=1 Tax=Linum tenue TaxID=586396 RepID=A0AAV0QQ40_9ROSI|nr:unnamed protein product [Linum tenue]